MNNKINKLVEKAQLKDILKQEFESTIEQRVERYTDLKPHEIIPNSHFAAVSAECYLLYRDGHYYGTVSLVQSVAEALVKFLCKVNKWKPGEDFKSNLKKLKKRAQITEDLKVKFNKIWQQRNNYHHLNPQMEQDRQKLEQLAKDKLFRLKQIEEELFSYSTNNGKLVPKFPKYWDQKNGEALVFLRFD